ncbi:MAG: D-2-hydroxyacid dehydrogenase [Opitutaceae bacterium]|nr:D-2-hydroxyacid dehydrogenase [Opitutaceae bacterium]
MNNSPNALILLAEDAPSLAKLRERCPGAKVTVGPWIHAEQALPREMLKDVDVLFCELPPSNFADFERLKWIQVTSSGYTQVLKLPILQKKIRVTNGLGTFDIPIAEWNIMMMLWWHRNMLEAQESQRARKWDRAPKYEREIRGSTVGFYGYGGIARETARLAKAMGLKVWALSRGPLKNRATTFCVEGTGDTEGVLPDRVFTPEKIQEFLSGLDYLIVTVPLTPATKGIIGEKELRMLQPSAVVLNCARGPIIEEQAFLRCLREGWIRGAATDVHYVYPLPPEHPLWTMPRVIITSHISGGSGGAHFLPRTYSLFTQNLERYCAGKPLLNELTREQLQEKPT